MTYPAPRSLVRLAATAFRRTAVENSARLLAIGAALLLLADGARRATTPRALDLWLVAALSWAVVLPAAVAGDGPLRSVRLALLPVPPAVLRRARLIAGAPLRLLLVVALPLLGALAMRGAVGAPALLSLVAWGAAALAMGAALDDRWHRAGAGGWRVAAALVAGVGGWHLWCLRTVGGVGASAAPMPSLPPLLPRTDDGWGWPIAAACVVAGASLLVARLRHVEAPSAVGAGARPAPRRVASAHTAPPAEGSAPAIVPRRVPSPWGPRVACEVALLARHVAPRGALVTVALLACAATHGRVPMLALAAALPMVLLTANALGADAVLGGLVRHALLPEPPARVRDRRLSVWAVATAGAAVVGATVGLVLPTPAFVARPPGGAFAAPAALAYAAALVPWFGRASWWWTRGYPQPMAQRLRGIGVRRPVAGPAGPAHLALALLGAWGAVAIMAGLVLGATLALTSASLRASGTAAAADGGMAWPVATLLAAVVASVGHGLVGRLGTVGSPGTAGRDRGSASAMSGS